MSARGTSNSAVRGSSYARRARKQWLLNTFGDGTTAPCSVCDVALDITTITVDRIVPGALGGRYVRANIRPNCQPCASRTGVELREQLKREATT